MKNEFIVNIIHRPELSPEYAMKALGAKKGEFHDESLDIFLFQQETAHKNGLKTTIQMTYASLYSDVIVEIAKEHHEKYGDEIGLSLLGLPCKQFKEKYKTDDFCIWMFDEKTKAEIIDDVFGMFHERFGFYPESTSCYFLDAFCLNYIHAHYPSVKTAVAACWEEGPKAYHTCNNSWYTFLDGGPWNPWIASKENSHCPAFDEADDCGIVCIPHLSRDLLACYDGNGSNFGTHPQNVLRGMIYYEDQGHVEYPYLYNLIDQYRHLAKYNDGYSYNMMFVGPGWLNSKGRWECPYETLKQSYEDGMAYYGELKRKGELIDMTMAEFGAYYRKKHPDYHRPEVALWKDILYGSNKEYLWYADPYLRTCLDFNQGGAMIDLRSYVSRVPQKTGIGTEHIFDASYPYLIQANYRAGYFTHYAGAGTLKSCKVSYRGETTDLALCRTMAKYEKTPDGMKVTTNACHLRLAETDIDVVSTFEFKEGSGEIKATREVVNGVEGVEFEEYMTGAYSTTEYQGDMSEVRLGVGPSSMEYAYQGRKISGEEGVAYVDIPSIQTHIELRGEGIKTVEEGIAFSPVYRLSVKGKAQKGGFVTWLKLAKAN